MRTILELNPAARWVIMASHVAQAFKIDSSLVGAAAGASFGFGKVGVDVPADLGDTHCT